MTVKKRVLHISTYYPPHIGGIENTAADIVKAIYDEYEQMIFVFNDKNVLVNENINGIKVVRCKANAKISSQVISLQYKTQLKSCIKDFNPNIIHFHFPNPFGAHYLLKLIKGRTDIALVVHYHSDIVRQKFLGKFFKHQTQKLLCRAKVVIATSPQYIANSKFLLRVKDKCRVIPSCVNDNLLALHDDDELIINNIKEEEKGKIIGLFIGRHVSYKGLDKLILAAELLDKNIVLRIGGTGPLTNLLIKKAKGNSNIKFIGKIENVRCELAAADIFVFPSITKNEAFGLALAEAMYMGKPAVTFHIDGSGVNFVGINGLTCLESENGNIEQLACAINKLAKNNNLRKQLGENAHKRAKELFSFEVFVNKIKQLYQEIINENCN